MKDIAFIILSLLVCDSGFTQDQEMKDSLRKVIQTSNVDSTRIGALLDLSFYENLPSLRLELAYKALHLSKQIKWPVGESNATGYGMHSCTAGTTASQVGALDHA